MVGTRLVLYVEDDDAAFTLVRIILNEEAPEIRLVRALDGEQALAFLRRSPPYQESEVPDLILLDMNLPKKNGFEVLSELKAAEPLRSIPVVMFSTSSSPRERDESLSLGALEYVEKPAGFDAFVRAVKTACSSLEKPRASAASE
jgi:CheY-like chemotaxis protein